MALRLIFTLAVVLFPAAAQADCASEAQRVREAILTSGSFHYKSKQWNNNFDRVQTGIIVPNKAEHIVETAQSTHGRRSAGGETILIGKQSWAKDSLGWLPPHGESWTHQLKVPVIPYEASATKCLGAAEVEGQTLIKYEQNSRIRNQDFIEKIFVEPATGLPVRYERSATEVAGINVINVYRYDASIKVEPPQVELAQRKEKSFQAFEESVASADPNCRQEVIKTIEHGQTALPFHYEIVGRFWFGVDGIRGAFVPPNSVHNIVDGDPYHGGGRETLTIGGQTWGRRIGQEWMSTSRRSPMAGAITASWSGSMFFPGYLIGVSEFIGHTLCLGEVGTARGQLSLYEYELYRDQQGERTRLLKRRMFADPARGLPLKFEDLDYDGVVARHEVRSYDNTITLTPPIIVPDRTDAKALPPGAGGLY